MRDRAERLARAICEAEGYDPESVWAVNDPFIAVHARLPRGELAMPAWKQGRFTEAAAAAILTLDTFR